MKPEIILQSDLLDILFYGKNKGFGAYPLRKNYNRRLLSALVITAALVLLFSLLYILKNKFFPEGEPRHILIAETELSPTPAKQSKKDVEKPKEAGKKAPAQVDHAVIKIVPDNLADKSITPNDDLDKGIISVESSEGAADSGLVKSTIGSGAGESQAVATIPPAEPTGPLEFAEAMPEFPGGQAAFMKFMLGNLKEPEQLEEGEKVVVKVRFVVEKDGSIVDAVVVSGKEDFSQEVLRVLRKMPRWKPGMQNGLAVPVYFTLPVTFVPTDN